MSCDCRRKCVRPSFGMDRAFMEAVVEGFRSVSEGSTSWTHDSGTLHAEIGERRKDGTRFTDVRIERPVGSATAVISVPAAEDVRIVESGGPMLVIDGADISAAVRGPRRG